jgi:co-chaperonin GroES (HSP10)
MGNATSDELKTILGKPEITKLQALGTGIRVGEVLGNRVLIRTVAAYTDMERVEKEGLLVFPETTKDANTPLASTGYIIKVGTGVSEEDRGYGIVEGAMVMFSKYAGTDYVIDGLKGFRMLDVRELMCTVIDTKSVVVPIKELDHA